MPGTERHIDESSTLRMVSRRASRDMQHVLSELAWFGGAPIETLSAPEARRQPTPTDAVRSLLRKDRQNPDDSMGVETANITIPGASGAIEARIYRPQGLGDSRLPVVLYFHGGGFVIADLDVYDGGPRGVSKLAEVAVVSVRYRQAPEHQFPAAHEDAIAAYRWILENAQTFNGDPQRVAVMGESAGGNLAINVAIAARDQGLQAPVHQVLVYPLVGNDLETESYRQHANAKPLNKAMIEWFVKQTFANPNETRDPRINVVGAAPLENLPDATIILAEIDPLRSEGEKLAARLQQAGSEVQCRTFAGCTHEFFGMAAVVPDAMAAQRFAADELIRAFSAVTAAN